MKKKTKSRNPKGAKTAKLSGAVEAAAPTETPAEPTQTRASTPAQSSAEKRGKVAKTRGPKTAEKPAERTRKTITKRYSPESKAEILGFVRDHDASNRRGGKSAAVRKYGVSALTLSNWLKASKRDGKRVKAEGQAKVPVSTKRGRTAGSSTSSIEVTLKRMLEIRRQVTSLMSEFESLKARI